MGEAIAKACFGVLLLYAGNLLVNDSARGIGHELEKRRLRRDVWSDASRRPEIVPEKKKEGDTGAD